MNRDNGNGAVVLVDSPSRVDVHRVDEFVESDEVQ